MYNILCKEDQTEWTKEEVLDHINTNGFFASMKLNGIFIGPLIYTNPPSPGEIGLLPYIASKEELDKTSKEELDETSKEGTIETSDKDET